MLPNPRLFLLFLSAVLPAAIPLAAQPGSRQALPPDTRRGAVLPQTPPYPLTPEDKQAVQTKIDELGSVLRRLKARHISDDLLADVEVYQKAGIWILQFPEEFFTREYLTNTLTVLDRGLERARHLERGESPWMTDKGRVIHGYRSALDGSVQPYGVTVPESYDGKQPVRLDVHLHGRWPMLNEVEFIWTYSDPKMSAWIRGSAPVGQIQLDVYGRWNNAYHLAGETDIFEAIAAVQRRYKIDPNRIALRGFSMGGAGAWHLALHYPDRWSVAEIGAGSTRSRRFGQPGLPPYQRAVLNIQENIAAWAMNLFNLPTVGNGGELDPQLQASVNVREELAREGIHFEGDRFALHAVEMPALFLVSAQTHHDITPEVRHQMDVFLKEMSDRGMPSPNHIRFVTYTTRYNHAYWATLDELEHQYDRAELDAVRGAGEQQYRITTKNLTRLVLREMNHAETITIDGEKLNVKSAPTIALERTGDGWRVAGLQTPRGLHKRHGLQGPIDDAFLDPFLCVRPTGKPWNEVANREALRALERFDRIYAKTFRAHPRIKDDRDVTASDLAKYHLILFGDPGSNEWIAKIKSKLPLRWTRQTITLGGNSYSAAANLPAMIYPNPLSPSHYVVLNTGMTSEARDFRSDYMMPRLGDVAILKVGEARDVPEIAWAGLFDESWKLP
ncbi:MAG TPA: alpha/beta hydrolase-fold protein [Bryobacteraceae bacterium]|nr:alpha/beta hydrolase-fold protein [Bryobacteraceae bacterium]